jgi:hypothetical protein
MITIRIVSEELGGQPGSRNLKPTLCLTGAKRALNTFIAWA